MDLMEQAHGDIAGHKVASSVYRGVACISARDVVPSAHEIRNTDWHHGIVSGVIQAIRGRTEVCVKREIPREIPQRIAAQSDETVYALRWRGNVTKQFLEADDSFGQATQTLNPIRQRIMAVRLRHRIFLALGDTLRFKFRERGEEDVPIFS